MWGLNQHVGSQSACFGVHSDPKSKFGPHVLCMQNRIQCSPRMFTKPIIHTQCDTTFHMIVLNTTASGNKTLLIIYFTSNCQDDIAKTQQYTKQA